MLQEKEVETLKRAVSWLVHLEDYLQSSIASDDVRTTINELRLVIERTR